MKELDEETKKSFATGVTSEAASVGMSGAKTAADTLASTEEIEERCPARYADARPDVTYGSFVHGEYDSVTCGRKRGYMILLPAGYCRERKYPVLYLLHGIFGDEYSFPRDSENRLKEITANMAKDGLIEETIVVCPNMYASSDPQQQPGFTKEACLPYDRFIYDLTADLMPHIETTYSVRTGRENTYLAGFSMGGRETIYITLKRPELFGYVCAISAAPGIIATKDAYMTHEGMMSGEEMRFADGAVLPESFLICCGTKDSVVGTYPMSYHKLLEKNGAAHTWYEIPEADHDNGAIRSGIYNLFKQIAGSEKN